MRNIFYWVILLTISCLAGQGLASEITIWDNQSAAQGNAWYTNQNEDQEVEPGASTASGWDLEGMFYENGKLSIVGEWNFIGIKDKIGSGDIFISTTGSAIYGDSIVSPPTADVFTNSFGYNYVFDVDWKNYANGFGTYDLIQIDETTKVKQTQSFYKGNPATYVGGGANDTLIYSGTFYFAQTDDVNFIGKTHYTVSNFDLSKIDGFDGSFIAHFTQECGNDVIMGQVPEPATMLLLGMGLLGIGAIGRKLPLKTS